MQKDRTNDFELGYPSLFAHAEGCSVDTLAGVDVVT